MKLKPYRGYVRNLATMACSERISSDFEKLADLPDGHLTIDVIGSTAVHSVAGPLSLSLAEYLSGWFRTQAKTDHLDLSQVSAKVMVNINTRDPETQKKTLVSFHLSCEAVIEAGGQKFQGKEKHHFWYNRPANQQVAK